MFSIGLVLGAILGPILEAPPCLEVAADRHSIFIEVLAGSQWSENSLILGFKNPPPKTSPKSDSKKSWIPQSTRNGLLIVMDWIKWIPQSIKEFHMHKTWWMRSTLRSSKKNGAKNLWENHRSNFSYGARKEDSEVRRISRPLPDPASRAHIWQRKKSALEIIPTQKSRGPAVRWCTLSLKCHFTQSQPPAN